MAEEFLQGGVCWWSSPSPRSIFSSTPCSNDIGSFGWPGHDVHSTVTELKSVPSSDDSGCSASDGSMPLNMMATPEGWNQDLIRDSGRSEENYSDFLLDTSMNYSKNFSEDSTMTTVKQSGYGGEQQLLDNSLSSPASYSYASSLLQTLFDTDSQPPLSHTNGFLPMAKQQPWNATSAPLADARPTNFLPSPPSRFLPSSLANHSIGAKQHEQAKDLTTAAKKASNEPPSKRPRFETPSSLPTFKVRKEKLGDRITALQQLVSPFGKTDTASVLHEAIEYIRFLHDQVNALSTPYLKYGSPPVATSLVQGTDKRKGEDGLKKDLKTRGLCLVPISSTFPVASETTADFWTPTFGGSFR